MLPSKQHPQTASNARPKPFAAATKPAGPRRTALRTVTNTASKPVSTATQHKKQIPHTHTFSSRKHHVNTNDTTNDIHDSSNDTDGSLFSEESKPTSQKQTYSEDLVVHYSDDTEIEEDEDEDEYDETSKFNKQSEFRRVDVSSTSTIDADDDEDETSVVDVHANYATALESPQVAPNYCVTIVSRSSSNPDAICPVWDRAAIDAKMRLVKEFSNMPGIFDEDDEDTFDIAMAVEYSDDIFEYMRELEFRYLPDMSYMERQVELDWTKRGILLDWLVRIHDHCNLLPETLFLTVHYIDRFLSIKAVGPAKLQLVGIVALFVAAKYEEITCPSVQEIAYMVDDEYSVDEIIRAERFMINLLEFNLGWPGPMSFLRRSSKADDYDSDTRTLAKYLLEITLMDRRFVGSQASWLAAAAHLLSRKILCRGPWTKSHEYFSGYSESQLQPAVDVLVSCCRAPNSHHLSIYTKYSKPRFKWASLHVAEWISNL